MTDVFSGHSQFVLLADDRRSRWFDAKQMFLIALIGVPIVIFCGIYTIMLKSSESLTYPKSIVYAPPLLVRRTELYGEQQRNALDFVEPHWKITDSLEATEDDFKLVCYYNFPGQDSHTLYPEEIDPGLCTHINVAFARIVNNTLHLSGDEIKLLQRVVDLKRFNSDLKILLSVGGAGHDTEGYPKMVSNHTTRKTFIKSVLDYVRDHHIDGVDLDWEFPNENPESDKHQKMHFTQLLLEFRRVINRQNRHKFLLSVAVAAPVILIERYYDVSYMNQSVDYVNLMTYDFHFYTKYTPFTGFNAPLYQSNRDGGGYFSTLNINYSANYWSYLGMDRRKIIVGLPTYAHTFRLTNPQNNGLYAPTKGYGKLGSNGFADYTQVCKFLVTNQMTPVFDLDAKSPYASKLNEWISFENEQSIVFKAEFIRDQQFGGAMVYSLNADDFSGSCKIDTRAPPRSFPLINRVHEILDKNYSIF